MDGILRTTSRFESENSFFANYLNKNLTLVEYWMQFDYALESHMHKQLFVDNDALPSIPKLKMHMDLKKQGKEVCTHILFYFFKYFGGSCGVHM